MQMHKLLVAATVAATLVSAGCSSEKVDDAKAKAEEVKAKAANAVAAKIEAKLADYLQCHGWNDKQVIAAIKDALKNRDQISAGDLLVAPDGVAELTVGARDAREVARELAELFREIAEQEGVFKGGKPAVTFNGCKDTSAQFPCIQGKGSIAFKCDDSGFVPGTATFDKCNLGKFTLDGKITVSVIDQSLVLKFDAFGIGASRTVTGGVLLAAVATETGLAVALDKDAGQFVMNEHGGHDSGLSCGRTVALSKLDLQITAKRLTANAALQVTTKEDTVALETVAPHLTWSWAEKCSCPDNGSVGAVTMQRPGGDKGEMVRMVVTFAAAPDDVGLTCRGAAAKVINWPKDCTVADKLTKACGQGARDALERLSGTLASHMCVPFDWNQGS